MPEAISTLSPYFVEPSPKVTNILKPSFTFTPSPTPTTTPIVLENGWYLYVDKDAGYSFSYPPETFFQTSKEWFFQYKTVRLQFRIPDSAYQWMVIDIYVNSQNQTIAEFVQQMYATGEKIPSLAEIKSSISSIKVGEFDAYKSVYRPALPEFMVFVPFGNKIIVAIPVTKMGLNAFEPQSVELFNQILATLSFEP